ncbi:MAG: hypothetical protein M1831_000860 [Alyxoria varia]|nr:MAG: hypothetical protein M1831_000860 [Alyxoria varia]
MSASIDVAICGGGLAGAALARSLLKIPHVRVRIFEGAPAFRESGAAVGLTVNAQRALRSLGHDLWESFIEAGAHQSHGLRLMIGEGKDAGTHVCDVASDTPPFIVHRASFLEHLLAPIPAGVLHVNRKLAKIDDSKEKIVMEFEDGSTAETDLIIGSDGIRGRTRSYILGDDSPIANPIYSGWWDIRNLVPAQKAVEFLGSRSILEPALWIWIGTERFLMHDVLDKGQTVQCVGAAFEKEASSEKLGTALDQEKLLQTFECYGSFGEGMAKILADQEDPTKYLEWAHEDAPTYFRGRVCMMGDAAHAMTPWQGAGAGQAIEDALILQALFQEAKSPGDLDALVFAFDAVRRPRCKQVTHSSLEVGYGMTGMRGIDAKKLREEVFKGRWDHLINIDLNHHVQEALELMRNKQSADK